MAYVKVGQNVWKIGAILFFRAKVCWNHGVGQTWLKAVAEQLPEDKVAEFKEKAPEGVKYLLGKIKDLQLWVQHSSFLQLPMIFALFRSSGLLIWCYF